MKKEGEKITPMNIIFFTSQHHHQEGTCLGRVMGLKVMNIITEIRTHTHCGCYGSGSTNITKAKLPFLQKATPRCDIMNIIIGYTVI